MNEPGSVMYFLLNLPHPMEFIWLVWLVLLPNQIKYLLRINSQHTRLEKGGELFNFREITAVGCIGGFPILTLIFFYTASITLELAGVI